MWSRVAAQDVARLARTRKAAFCAEWAISDAAGDIKTHSQSFDNKIILKAPVLETSALSETERQRRVLMLKQFRGSESVASPQLRASNTFSISSTAARVPSSSRTVSPTFVAAAA